MKQTCCIYCVGKSSISVVRQPLSLTARCSSAPRLRRTNSKVRKANAEDSGIVQVSSIASSTQSRYPNNQ
ncbi:hypothetical protein Tcan_16806 [Toxocara canis]|uniref:Uncharacterized protein n=1 Tax=Toxocara canis TaxID=6265 RepID=A0A0B2VSZ3_TOXCA|nr:hypothetical protein Tcan_16806 [Toxocara canis]